MSALQQMYPINNTLFALNSTYTINNAPYAPVELWTIFAAICIVFTALSFAYRIRNQDGVISSERLAFSLIAAFVNLLTALMSRQIAIPTSVAQATLDIATGTQLVVVQNFTVYGQVETVIFFSGLSIITLGNFVYTLMQPQLLKSDPNETDTGPNRKKDYKEEK